MRKSLKYKKNSFTGSESYKTSVYTHRTLNINSSPIISNSSKYANINDGINGNKCCSNCLCCNYCRSESCAMLMSLISNFILLGMKIAFACYTLSLINITTLLDTVVDIFSQFIIYWTSRVIYINSIKYNDKYPAGIARIEGIGVVIIACSMIFMSVIMIQISSQQIINYFRNGTIEVLDVNFYLLFSLPLNIVIKFILWLWCRSYISPNMKALSQDHLNDVLTHIVSLSGIFVASLNSKYWYVDPIGAIIISLYIIYAWFALGIQEIRSIIGINIKHFEPELYKQLSNEIKTIFNKNKNIRNKFVFDIKTLIAYKAGKNVVVEIKLNVKPETIIFDYYYICNHIQNEIEKIPYIDRAYIEYDYSLCFRNRLNGSHNITIKHN